MRRAQLGAHQAALYDAEAEALTGMGRRWRRLAEVQAYVDELIGSEWFFERWSHVIAVSVERRGSGARWSASHRLDAEGSEGVLLLAPGAFTEPVVLHELAHLVLPEGTGHDERFAETLLVLVRHQMGIEAFAALRQALGRRPAFAALRVPA